MSYLPPTPPPPHRLFIGNLPPSLPLPPLLSLLSAVHPPTSLSLHPSRNFAHATLPLPAVHRACDLLHGTTWRGVRLVVQKAAEHWAARLTREWHDQHAPAPALAPILQEREDPNNLQKVASGNKGIGDEQKGKHTRFTFDDVADVPDLLHEAPSWSMQAEFQPDENGGYVASAERGEKGKKRSRVTPRSAALGSTLELFGLGGDSDDAHAGKYGQRDEEEKGVGTKFEDVERSVKRSRRTEERGKGGRKGIVDAKAGGDEGAEEGERGVGREEGDKVVDLEKERVAALGVLRGMQLGKGQGNKGRRLGLFRRLPGAVERSEERECSGRRKGGKRKEMGVTRGEGDRVGDREDLDEVEGRKSMKKVVVGRRLGLYRRLEGLGS